MYYKSKIVINLKGNKGQAGSYSLETFSPAHAHYRDAAGDMNRLYPKAAPWKVMGHRNEDAVAVATFAIIA